MVHKLIEFSLRNRLIVLLVAAGLLAWGIFRASVWVQTGKNTFKNKMVTVGMESGDRLEITDGLDPGEAVVISGAYLVNSEYIFKRGASPMAEMDMGNIKM